MEVMLKLRPVFKEMIWGGDKLQTDFHYDIPSDKTGECWAVSAHQNGDCTIEGGEYDGKKLSWLWENRKELFGNASGDRFPLLVKIIDAKDDLSIQVHPDDAYAKEHEHGSLGKTECWYVLDCEDDATIVVGHNAQDKNELVDMIKGKQWSALIKEQPIHRGDFFQITPGTVHAIKHGTVILEIQQSSDITYRLYDYDRLQNGKPRDLHLEKSIDVIKCPYCEATIEPIRYSLAHGSAQQLIDCKCYTVERLMVDGINEFTQSHPFEIVSVINGEGRLNNQQVKKGDHFILPFEFGKYTLDGSMEVIISHI